MGPVFGGGGGGEEVVDGGEHRVLPGLCGPQGKDVFGGWVEGC